MKIYFKIITVVILASVLGCTGTKVRKEKPADLLYNEAAALFERKNYEDAIAGFQELTAKYPLSKYTVQAKLKIADSYFMDENYPEAISTYRDFEKLHPTNESVPYAIYQTGMSYFNQILTIDRDQTAAMNAATEFSRLISRFPDNQYAEPARKNLTVCRSNLAENEFYIGNFYFKKGKYKASIERFNSVMERYPDFAGMDKVLFHAGTAYIKVNEDDKGKALLNRLLERYPDSKFAKDARGMLDVR